MKHVGYTLVGLIVLGAIAAVMWGLWFVCQHYSEGFLVLVSSIFVCKIAHSIGKAMFMPSSPMYYR